MEINNNNKILADGLELFKQSYWHRLYNVNDIYRYLIAPIKPNRIRIYYQNNKPIGLITWCWLDKDSGRAFLKGDYYITEEDYIVDNKEELWGIEFIAPYGHTKQIISLMRKEYHSIYQRKEEINWRRLHDPTTRHIKKV
mgnify:FL=1